MWWPSCCSRGGGSARGKRRSGGSSWGSWSRSAPSLSSSRLTGRRSLADQVSAEAMTPGAHAPGGALMEKLGLEFLDVSPERIVARMPVEGNTQPYGLLHGGATASLCETIGSFGTAMAVGPEKVVTGIEINVNHLKAVTEGHVTGTGTPVHIGRTTAVWDMRLHDDRGRPAAL